MQVYILYSVLICSFKSEVPKSNSYLADLTEPPREHRLRNLISSMSNDDNASGTGRTLDGRAAEPLPSTWVRQSSNQRVGRIGDWAT